MHRRRTAFAAVGVAAATALAAGCGNQQAGVRPLSGSPHQQVQGALQNLTRGDTLTGTLHLGTDAASLLRFGSRMGGSNLSDRQAQALAGATLRFTVHSTEGSLSDLAKQQGQPSPSAQQFDLGFTDQGRQYAELRVVDGNLYVQADVKGLTTLVGQPPATYERSLRQAQQLPGGFSKAATAFMTGKWVELPGSQLQSLAKKARSQPGANTLPSPNAMQRRKFLANLEGLFAKDVTVKQTRSTSGGGTYNLTANTRKLMGSFLSSVVQLEPTLGSQLGSMNLSQVPSRAITFQAQVSNDRLSRLSFDFSQLVGKPDMPHLPLDLDFSTASASVSAPTGAVTANINALVRALVSSQSGTATGSAGAGSVLG